MPSPPFIVALILGIIATSRFNGEWYHLSPLLTNLFMGIAATAMLLVGIWSWSSANKNSAPVIWKRQEIKAKQAALEKMKPLALLLPTKASLPYLLTFYSSAQFTERLTVLLQGVDESDANLLGNQETERMARRVYTRFVAQGSDFRRLWYIPAKVDRNKKLAYVRALLSALKHVGTEEQMLRLAKLTKQTARNSEQAEMVEAILAVLPEWQARLQVQNTPQTLLRASAASQETLLRPVVTSPTDPQHLLRPDSVEEPK